MSSLEELVRENTELRNRLAEMERALEERSRVVSIVEASSEAILSTAMDGTIVSWNRAAEQLYGHTPGEAVGRSDLELVPFDRLTEHKGAIARALRGEAVVLETKRRRRDGTVVDVTVMYAGLSDPNGKSIGVATIAHKR